MHPTIRDGEVVTVAPRPGIAFAVGDVLLCRFGRRPTAHRVVAVQPSADGRPVLYLQGDNLCSPDRRFEPGRHRPGADREPSTGVSTAEMARPSGGRHARGHCAVCFRGSGRLGDGHGCERRSAQIGTDADLGGRQRPQLVDRQNWNPAGNSGTRRRPDFSGFPVFLTTINDLVDLSVNSVTIQGGYTISGLALEITGDPGLLVESPAAVTVSLDLTLNRDPIHVASNRGTLELSGRITARNFVKQGGGTLVLSGANPDITDLIGEDGCGVIRATNPLALGVSLVGRIQLGQNCTLQVEADTTLDKPIIVNGLGAPGTTGALVVTAGVTLTERLELRLDSPAKISVLSGATLDLPQSQVGLTMNLNSPLTVNVAQAGVAGSAE